MRTLSLLLMPVVMFLTTQAHASTHLDRMQAFYRKLGPFETTFTSTPHDPLQGAGNSEKGRVLVGSEGRFRLTYRTPEYKDFIYDGKQVFFYEPEASQVTITESLEGSDLAVIIRLLSGKSVDLAQFDIISSGADEVQIARKASAPKGGLHRAVLTISPQGALKRASIMDPAGGRVDYVFGDVKAKPKLANKVFDFKIPEGVEVQRVKL